MDSRQGKIIGWFGVVMNLLCLFAFEFAGIANRQIAGSFVFNLVACIIWLVGLGMNFMMLLIIALFGWAIPLVIWVYYISFTAHNIFSGETEFFYLHRENETRDFWSGVFILVFSSVYDFIALKHYLKLKSAPTLTQEFTPSLNVAYEPTTNGNCAINKA
ncbi:uncharacterized protein LOC116347247 [Contarinia nasturtii]|uniref:uncharacterized protein LOC116347247 n=1 Tax=Contarinia nasturtii TaxID=265458 RepID=UPI0012D3B2A9|nr:uncharacterized protein LOC116347247 [Contarinia nasturtii]